MSIVSSHTVGEREWEHALERKLEALDRATYLAVLEGLVAIEQNAKLLLRLRSHPEGTPTPSPLGEPPALITGTLTRSYKRRGPRRGVQPYTTIGEIGPTAVYARIQELGGFVRREGRGRVGPQPLRSYTRIPARPYHSRAVKGSRHTIHEAFKRRWTTAILS